ncbi:MAG: hypothetical protein CVU13_10745 [Bacteroidetes bacterium HGW-Bacteroidetes-8]|jgi:hypothetical protein|nr:MAG: hypothetical protein CVU13_10745 [Bacteroidetes bacterium HGW-Bacteroidetes-8]
MLKRFVIKVVLFFLLINICNTAFSQVSSTGGSSFTTDTTFRRAPVIDSSYLNKDIFELIARQALNGSVVKLKQSQDIVTSMQNHIANSSQKKINGYRIRIFFDNKQDARVKSENIRQSFTESFPGVGVYWTYDAPYFKVTVGDLRSKSDAMKMLKRLQGSYPSAFIVREHINFPPL